MVGLQHGAWSAERETFIAQARSHGTLHVFVRLCQFTVCGALTAIALLVRGLLYTSYTKYSAPPSAPPAPSMAPPAYPDPFTHGWQDDWWWSRQIDIIWWDRFAILLLLCACAWRPWQEIIPNVYRRLKRSRRRPHIAASEHPAAPSQPSILVQVPTSDATMVACGSFLTLRASTDQPVLVTALRSTLGALGRIRVR
jgi:hypothetical protein